MNDSNSHAERFSHQKYMVQTKFFRIFGGAFYVFNAQGQQVLYSDQKRFRLKEDISLYSDESMRTELLRIRTQSILDISGAYDIQDSITGERIGTLKRGGLKSTFVQDFWEIRDAGGQTIGTIQEDSALKGMIRRFFEYASLLMPQTYHVRIGDREVAKFSQRFNPIIMKLDVDFSPDHERRFDRRLGLAAAVLVSAIEGGRE